MDYLIVIMVIFADIAESTIAAPSYQITDDANDNTAKYSMRRKNQYARYEVREDVDDIPNNATIFGPVVVNYTLTNPINLVNNSKGKMPNKEINKSTSNINILHIQAKFDDKNDVNNFNVLPNIKEHVFNVKKNVIDTFNDVFKLNGFNNVNKGVVLPNVIATPVQVLHRLHEKTVAASNSIHKAIFGSKHHDIIFK